MAINFPSTAGQATDGTFTYVVAGITYSWNGESWTAAGGGATATDRTVFSVTNASAGSTSLSYNNNTGVFTYTPPDLSSFLTSTGPISSHTDVDVVSPTNGQLLRYNSANFKWENDDDGAGSNLDADLLDGNHGSFYQNASNLNTGTLNSARLSGSYGISISGSAASIPTVEACGNVSTSSTASGQVLSFDGSNWVNADAPSVRKVISYTATSLSTDTSGIDFSFTTPKTYALLEIEVSHACWVTLYSDTASRTADATRLETVDPIPGSGVLSEVITAGATAQLITPGAICFNSSGSNITYAKLVNKSGSTVNLQVQLTLVPIEA